MTTYYFYHSIIDEDSDNTQTILFWEAIQDNNRGKHTLDDNDRFYGRDRE